MVVQHNLPAMNSHRQLSVNNTSTSQNLEKLSSGYRINRAGDDAAGLAISEKMRGQIRGLGMATTNAQNGVSLIQTAEGGLNETHAVLQRMRELAVQSANGTYADEVDRENINKEVQSLKNELDRISSSTHYNGIKLLDGSLGGKTMKSLGSAAAAEAGITGLGFYSATTALILNTINAANFIGQDAKLVVIGGTKGDTAADGVSATAVLQIGDKTYKLATQEDHDRLLGLGLNVSAKCDFIDADGRSIARLTADYGGTSATGSGVITIKEFTGVLGGIYLNDDKNIIATEKSQLIFQIGANGSADQRVGLHVDNMSSGFLGSSKANPAEETKLGGFKIIDVKVATREQANDSIKILDGAINQVSGTRADLGALQNRLEHTINNLGTTSENLQSAESTIRDVDMAKEMMEFTKNNILVQASQVMLAQSNILPQGVLSLLR